MGSKDRRLLDVSEDSNSNIPSEMFVSGVWARER